MFNVTIVYSIDQFGSTAPEFMRAIVVSAKTFELALNYPLTISIDPTCVVSVHIEYHSK